MTEVLFYSIGAISLASILGAFNAWLDRKSGKFTRQAMARRLALRLMAYSAGLDARDKAVAEAMEKRVTLEVR